LIIFAQCCFFGILGIQKQQLMVRDNVKFERVYVEYSGYVKRVCKKYFVDVMDAEDVAHDVFVKVSGMMDKVDPDCCKSFLYKVATTHCLDVIRRRKVRMNVAVNSVKTAGMLKSDVAGGTLPSGVDQRYTMDCKFHVVPDFIHGSCADCGSDYEYINMCEFINDNVMSMGDRKNKVFNMFAIEGICHTDIAKSMNMNINTVRVDYMKVRNKLRKVLDEENLV